MGKHGPQPFKMHITRSPNKPNSNLSFSKLLSKHTEYHIKEKTIPIITHQFPRPNIPHQTNSTWNPMVHKPHFITSPQDQNMKARKCLIQHNNIRTNPNPKLNHNHNHKQIHTKIESHAQNHQRSRTTSTYNIPITTPTRTKTSTHTTTTKQVPPPKSAITTLIPETIHKRTKKWKDKWGTHATFQQFLCKWRTPNGIIEK